MWLVQIYRSTAMKRARYVVPLWVTGKELFAAEEEEEFDD